MEIITNILRPTDLYAELRPDNTTTTVDTGSFALYGLRIEPAASVNGSPVVIRPDNASNYSSTFSSRTFNNEFGPKACETMRQFAATAVSKSDRNLSGSYENVYRFRLLRTDPDSTSVVVDSEDLTAGWFWPVIMMMSRNSSAVGNIIYDGSRAFESYTDSPRLFQNGNFDGSIHDIRVSEFGDITNASSLDVYVPLYGEDDPEFSIRIYNSETGESEILPWKASSEGFQGTVTFGDIMGISSGQCGATVSSKWGSESKWSAWKTTVSSAGGSLTGKVYHWFRYSKTYLNTLGFNKSGASLILNGYASESDGDKSSVDILDDAVEKLKYTEMMIPEVHVQAGFLSGTSRDWSKTPANQWKAASMDPQVHNEVLGLPFPYIFRMNQAGYQGVDMTECDLSPYFKEDDALEKATATYRFKHPNNSDELSGQIFGLEQYNEKNKAFYNILSPASGLYHGYIRTPDDKSTELTYSVSIGIKMVDLYRKFAPYRTDYVDYYTKHGGNKFAKDASLAGRMPASDSNTRFNGVMPQVIAGIVGMTSDSVTSEELGDALLTSHPVTESSNRYCRYCYTGAGSDCRGNGDWIGDNSVISSFDFAESLAGSYDFPVSGASGTWYNLGSTVAQSWNSTSKNKVYFVVMQRASSATDSLQQTARWKFKLSASNGSYFTFPDANAENQIERIGNYTIGTITYILYTVRYSKTLQSSYFKVANITRFQPEAATEYSGQFYLHKNDSSSNTLFKTVKTSAGKLTTPSYPSMTSDYAGYSISSKWVQSGVSNVSYEQNTQITLTKDSSYVLELSKKVEYTAKFYINKGGVTTLYKTFTTNNKKVTTPAYPTLTGDYDGYSYTTTQQAKWQAGTSSTYYKENTEITLSADTNYTIGLTKNSTHIVYLMASGAMEAGNTTGGQWIVGGLAGSGAGSTLLRIAYQENNTWYDAVPDLHEAWLSQRSGYGVTDAKCNWPEEIYNPLNYEDNWYITADLQYNKEYAILYRKSFTTGGTTYQIAKNGTEVTMNSETYILSTKFKLETGGITMTQSGTGWEPSNSSSFSHGPNPNGRWLLWQTSSSSSQPGLVYRSAGSAEPTEPDINTSSVPDSGKNYVKIAESNGWTLALVNVARTPSSSVTANGRDGLPRTIQANTFYANGLAVIWTGSGTPSGNYKLTLTNLKLAWNFAEARKIGTDTESTFYVRGGNGTVSNINCTFAGTSRTLLGLIGTSTFKTAGGGNGIYYEDKFMNPGNNEVVYTNNVYTSSITMTGLRVDGGQKVSEIGFKVTTA